ncbi:MAG: serine/threonine protein kinase [Deltaproteobacteria bacterium]|nr:serine/threonine protein kinase [Deltaproteobacteria bacterium]
MTSIQSLPGTVLSNRYVLSDPIGSGTFGVVFRAQDVRSGTQVIVKVLKGPYGFIHLDSFRREIDSARRIQHPSAVRIIDYGVADRDRPFLVMEAVDGVTLLEWASARRPLPIEACASVLLPVAELLSEAHAAGVVHCDVKPSHILVQGREGAPPLVKLVDFGIARIARSLGGDSTADGSGSPRRISGTPAYMSPERVLGGDYDGRADVYSLAIVLYELLTGRLPFDLRDDPRVGRDPAGPGPRPPVRRRTLPFSCVADARGFPRALPGQRPEPAADGGGVRYVPQARARPRAPRPRSRHRRWHDESAGWPARRRTDGALPSRATTDPRPAAAPGAAQPRALHGEWRPVRSLL